MNEKLYIKKFIVSKFGLKGLKNLFKFADEIPYSLLIIVSVFIVPAPFEPLPHFIEKLIMLKNGMLVRPLDIFDLFFHLSPILLIVIKMIRNQINAK